jgi:hypothetical protein
VHLGVWHVAVATDEVVRTSNDLGLLREDSERRREENCNEKCPCA